MSSGLLLDRDHLETIADSEVWLDNPFVLRDRRRDRARNQPLKSFLWMCGTMLVFGAPAFWGLTRLRQAQSGFPWFLGGDILTAMAIVISGIHAWFVIGAAQKGSLLSLAKEASQNTLPGLLLLPMSSFRLILSISMYSWLAAMRAAIVLLPIYVLLVGVDALSWADVLMLYLVFAMIGVCLPVWRRPIRSELVGSALPISQQGAGAAARSMTTQQAALQASGSQGAGGAGTSAGSGFAIVMVAPMFLIFFAVITHRGLAGVYDVLGAYVPNRLIDLLSTSILSWPLIIARSIVTPFSWFHWNIWPLPFVLGCFLCNKYAALVRTGEFLDVGLYRDLPHLPTYSPRRNLEAFVRWFQALVITGYLWKWAIDDGGLAGVTLYRGPAALPGLTAFALFLLAVGCMRGIFRANQMGTWSRSPRTIGTAVRAMKLRSAIRYIAGPLGESCLLYICALLLSGSQSYGLSIRDVAAQVLAVAIPGLILAYCAGRALGSLTSLTGLSIVLAWTGVTSVYHVTPLGCVAYLSPFLGLMHAARVPYYDALFVLGGGVQNRGWPFAECVAGLLLLTWTLSRRRSSELPEDMAEIEQPTEWDPAVVGAEAFADPARFGKGPAVAVDTPLGLGLIALIQRWFDNGVMVKELRVRLRGKLTLSSLRMGFVTLIVITMFAVIGAPGITDRLLGNAAIILYGTRLSTQQHLIACVLVGLYFALLIRGLFAGFATLGAFVLERDKSTIGFLFVTPLKTLQIVLGKLVGILVSSSLFAITMSTWALMLSLILTPSAGAVPIEIWAVALALTALAILTFGSFGMVLVSLFPKITPQHAGCIWALLINVVFQGLAQSARFLPRLYWYVVNSTGLSAVQLLEIVFVVSGLLICICLLLSTVAISRRRHGDVAFGGAKRES